MLSLDQQVQLALGHVRRHLTRQIGRQARGAAWEAFDARLARHFPALLRELAGVYGARADFLDVLARVVATAWQGWRERPADLRALDAAREAQPHWFQSERMLGGVCYVELYAGNLRGLMAQIPYFKELGLTYLHLMPPFLCPADNSDGGYAVSSYREIDPALGTIDDLRALAAALRREGISLVLDFIFNHTADEHAWARAAVAGEEAFRDFYLIFPDRTLPDAYDRTLREIFPDQHPGALTQLDDGRWIWTTFNSFQWDLNYANPAVFDAMAGEMLAIANLGAEILRMDAVAFIWKQLGTDCENLPQAHALIRAFNAVCRIAAPGLLFKSEAIVHPDQVVKYIAPEECQLSYNPLQMALLWNSLATREVNLLQQALEERHALPAGTAWVNYVRSHDDIGWTFAVQVNAAGQVELKLKTPWRDGTTHLVLSPLEFMQRLAALVPRPRLHLIRFHGVLAPNAKLRSLVVPQGPEVEERATAAVAASECVVQTETNPDRPDRPHRIAWARLLKRVFDIDMQHCPNCGAGELKIIAAILERPVIEKIQTHLGLDPQPPPRGRAREARQD